MKIGKGKLRRLAWLASFAILLNALAPTVSHGLSLWRGSAHGLIEVCTSFGIELIAVGDQPSQGGTPDGGMAGGCGYCLAHAGTFALPFDPPTASVGMAPGVDERPPLALVPELRSIAWTAPPSRGPPPQA